MYRTIEEALDAVEKAEQDVEADFPGGWDQAAPDVIRSIGLDCPAAVRAELFRREGIERA